MSYICRVCKRELIRFDDIVWRCARNETHRASIIVCLENGSIDFEHILIYQEPETHYGFEFNYLQNHSQISKIQIHHNSEEMPAMYETSNPIYNQSGILEIDFDNLPALIDRVEKMETFS